MYKNNDIMRCVTETLKLYKTYKYLHIYMVNKHIMYVRVDKLSVI